MSVTTKDTSHNQDKNNNNLIKINIERRLDYMADCANGNPFSIVPEELGKAYLNGDMPEPMFKLMFLMIHHGKRFQIWRSTLEKTVSKASLKKYLPRLIDEGYIEVESVRTGRGGAIKNIYHVRSLEHWAVYKNRVSPNGALLNGSPVNGSPTLDITKPTKTKSTKTKLSGYCNEEGSQIDDNNAYRKLPREEREQKENSLERNGKLSSEEHKKKNKEKVVIKKKEPQPSLIDIFTSKIKNSISSNQLWNLKTLMEKKGEVILSSYVKKVRPEVLDPNDLTQKDWAMVMDLVLEEHEAELIAKKEGRLSLWNSSSLLQIINHVIWWDGHTALKSACERLNLLSARFGYKEVESWLQATVINYEEGRPLMKGKSKRSINDIVETDKFLKQFLASRKK